MTLERTGGTGRGVAVGAWTGAAGGIVGAAGKAARFSAGGASWPGLAHLGTFRAKYGGRGATPYPIPLGPSGTPALGHHHLRKSAQLYRLSSI